MELKCLVTKEEFNKKQYPVFGVDLTGQQKEIWNDYVSCKSENRGLDMDIEYIKNRERKGIPLSESETTDYLMGLLTQCRKRRDQEEKERIEAIGKKFREQSHK